MENEADVIHARQPYAFQRREEDREGKRKTEEAGGRMRKTREREWEGLGRRRGKKRAREERGKVGEETKREKK